MRMYAKYLFDVMLLNAYGTQVSLENKPDENNALMPTKKSWQQIVRKKNKKLCC